MDVNKSRSNVFNSSLIPLWCSSLWEITEQACFVWYFDFLDAFVQWTFLFGCNGCSCIFVSWMVNADTLSWRWMHYFTVLNAFIILQFAVMFLGSWIICVALRCRHDSATILPCNFFMSGMSPGSDLRSTRFCLFTKVTINF